MLIVVTGADLEVNIVQSSSAGQLVMTTTNGTRNNYIIVETDACTSLGGQQVVMHVDRAGRGMYYLVQPVVRPDR